MTVCRYILICLLIPTHTFAQSIPPLATDSRVRITAPRLMPNPLIGTIARIGPDTLFLTPRTRIPLNTITRFEVSLGVKPPGQRIKSGAWKGALLFAGIVAAAAAEDYDQWDNPSGNKVLLAVLGGGTLGGALGALYGALHRPERWAPFSPEHLKRYAPPAPK